MTEFDCVGEGYAIVDPEVDAMSQAYPGGAARFYVVEDDEGIAGCGGFARLTGSDESERICELRKMYFRPRLRGRGVGGKFLSHLLDAMRDAQYRTCYLETTSRMDAARRVYEKHGFAELSRALGDTGHSACDRFYQRAL